MNIIEAPKIVLDTNILIAIIGKKSPFRWIFDAVLDEKLILCVSNSILTEYREILELKNGTVVAENISNFLCVYPSIEKYDIFYDMNLIEGDADDDKFADCAFVSGAIIVSNDKHFKILNSINFPKIQLMNLQEFTNYFNELSNT